LKQFSGIFRFIFLEVFFMSVGDNRAYARSVVSLLAASGVSEAVLCAGNRNAALLEAFASQNRIKVFSHFSESSAVFFALGRIKLHGQPVAVVTTSGTAACELLAGVCEAFYEGLPLRLVTADLPRRFRGKGAPQGIDQRELFGGHVRGFWDIEKAEELPLPEEISFGGPVHLNVCFEDLPLGGEARPWDPGAFAAIIKSRDEEVDTALARELISVSKRPFVILGSVEAEYREQVCSFLKSLAAPVYAESLSGLRGEREIEALCIKGGSALISLCAPDLMLRIGGVPVTSFWRNLERQEKWQELPVLSFSSIPLPGLARESLLLPLAALSPSLMPEPKGFAAYASEVQGLDACLTAELSLLLSGLPRCEAALIRGLSSIIEKDALLYLGNSLPIRTWDLSADFKPDCRLYGANRGANGIDGQLSTFLGMCSEQRSNWCILGDLTVLYDLAAPFLLRELPLQAKVRLVVMNNQGGRIFEQLSSFELFKKAGAAKLITVEHGLSFAHWAAMWGIDYAAISQIEELPALPDRVLIELKPENEQTASFVERYRKAVRGLSLQSNPGTERS
jgi:2-succinyl-5-enolpyruvyl-6-hydroxy-3-cyclohexene-1-carboxylate synthase